MYAKFVYPSLREKLEELEKDERREERMKLHGEIDLARGILMQQLEVMTAVRLALDQGLKGASEEMFLMLQSQALQTARIVADLVVGMAKIDKDLMQDYTLTLPQLGYVAGMLTNVIKRHLGADPRAMLIAEELRGIKVPSGRMKDLQLAGPVEVEVRYDAGPSGRLD